MGSLDMSIVAVANPDIASSLHAGHAAMQLVVSGYSVVYAALLVTGARLGDDHGHRRLFLLGLAGFTAASLLCGVAGSPEMLVAARLLQGAAGAMMLPQVVTVIQLRFDGTDRARAFGLFATVISLGVVAGLVLGGVLVSADIAGLGWRPIFLVNVPVGVALLAWGARILPDTRGVRRRLDLGGVALMSLTVLLVIVPLVFGHDAGWAPWTWASLVASVPAGAALVRHLRRRADDPLLDLRLLRLPGVALGLASVAAQTIAWGGLLFTLTFYLQQGVGDSALRCGLTFAPYAAGFAVTSLLTPGLPARAQRVVLPGGLVVMAVAYVALGLLLEGDGWRDLPAIVLLTVAGAGFGCGYSPVVLRTVASVPPRNAPDASGLFTTVNQLAFGFGIATLGTVYLDAGTDGAALTDAMADIVFAGGALGLVAAVATALLVRAQAAGASA
jgi:MFS family permease